MALKRYKLKLEIWGRAQREAAGAVSPIGGQLRGWNFVRSKVTWPERNCIIIYSLHVKAQC